MRRILDFAYSGESGCGARNFLLAYAHKISTAAPPFCSLLSPLAALANVPLTPPRIVDTEPMVPAAGRRGRRPLQGARFRFSVVGDGLRTSRPPRRSALGSPFGELSPLATEGVFAPQRAVRYGLQQSRRSQQRRARVSPPYAEGGDAAPNSQFCVGRGALTPPRIPDAEPIAPARADVGIGPYENCGAMCVNENASRAAARTASE